MGDLAKMIAHKFEEEKDLNHCADLLYKLLALNPKDRISAADSLSHPYFADMHDEEEVLTGSKFGLRHMMFTALDTYHKKQWVKFRKKQKRREQKERDKLKKKEKHKERDRKERKHRDRDRAKTKES